MNNYIPYKLAVLAKENLFNEPCLALYGKSKQIRLCHHVVLEYERINSECQDDIWTAPTHQQMLDWFRIKHDLEISIKSWKTEKDGKIIYVYSIKKLGLPSTFKFDYKSEDYYECLNKAIEEAFKLI